MNSAYHKLSFVHKKSSECVARVQEGEQAVRAATSCATRNSVCQSPSGATASRSAGAAQTSAAAGARTRAPLSSADLVAAFCALHSATGFRTASRQTTSSSVSAVCLLHFHFFSVSCSLLSIYTKFFFPICFVVKIVSLNP